MLDMMRDTHEIGFYYDKDGKVCPDGDEAALLMSGAICVPWNPVDGDRRPRGRVRISAIPERFNIREDERRYGPSPYFVGCSLGHDPDEWAKSDKDISFHVSVGDGVCDAMIMRRAVMSAKDAKHNPDGTTTITYKDVKDYLWDHQPLLYDYRIPEGEEFDQACQKYAKRHPYLWEHRNDPDFGDSSEDRMAARRALWMLHEYDPAEHPERGTNKKLEDFWNLIDGKGCWGGRCFGDGLIERVARLREAVDPRWVMGDVCGLQEPGREAQALREVDADALEQLAPRLQRGAFVSPDEAEARCRLNCYHERAREIDEDVLVQQQLRNRMRKIDGGDIDKRDRLLAQGMHIEPTSEAFHEKFVWSINKHKDTQKKKHADALDYGVRAIRKNREAKTEYGMLADVVFPSLETRYDHDPLKHRLCHEMWTEQFARRAASFDAANRDIAADLSMRGMTRDVWEACGKGVLPEADERRMEDEDAETSRRERQARAEERDARIRRAALQHDMEDYERDRATRIRLHRPAPGDELTAEEHVVDARRREMADTGLSYDELYDDDPDHDFDPANW